MRGEGRRVHTFVLFSNCRVTCGLLMNQIFSTSHEGLLNANCNWYSTTPYSSDILERGVCFKRKSGGIRCVNSSTPSPTSSPPPAPLPPPPRATLAALPEVDELMSSLRVLRSSLLLRRALFHPPTTLARFTAPRFGPRAMLSVLSSFPVCFVAFTQTVHTYYGFRST